MLTTAAPPRTRIAGLATRARNIVDSGLCTSTAGVPEWIARLEQLEHLDAAPAADRRGRIRTWLCSVLERAARAL